MLSKRTLGRAAIVGILAAASAAAFVACSGFSSSDGVPNEAGVLAETGAAGDGTTVVGEGGALTDAGGEAVVPGDGGCGVVSPYERGQSFCLRFDEADAAAVPWTVANSPPIMTPPVAAPSSPFALLLTTSDGGSLPLLTYTPPTVTPKKTFISFRFLSSVLPTVDKSSIFRMMLRPPSGGNVSLYVRTLSKKKVVFYNENSQVGSETDIKDDWMTFAFEYDHVNQEVTVLQPADFGVAPQKLPSNLSLSAIFLQVVSGAHFVDSVFVATQE